MITSTASHRDFFKNLAAELGLHFVYGASERILMGQLGDIEYPCLWLGKPRVRLVRDGGLHRRFEGEFWILDNADADDFAGQDSKLDATFLVTEQVLQKMQAGADTNQFIFDMADAASDPKDKWSGDNCVGWVTDYHLTGAACETVECCT